MRGTVYNIEMQCSKKRNLSKRTRYYAGSIDLDLIAAGEDYINLKMAYVIFLCTFDPFCDGRHIYTFENRCKENLSLSLGDESVKIFLNTRGTMDDVDEEMKEFLAYVEDTTDRFAARAKSPLIRQIHRKVIEVKQNPKMEVEYMTLMQRDRENIELGREEGIKMALDIIRLHLDGKADQEIAAMLSLRTDYVRQVLENYAGLSR